MLAPYVWACPRPLDLATLQQAAAYILGTHDFTSFAAADPDLTTRTDSHPQTHDPTPTPDPLLPTPCLTRTIHHSTWHQQDDLLIYRVTGSGFLHHMVRNLVGTFVEAATAASPPTPSPTSSPPATAPPPAPPPQPAASSSSRSNTNDRTQQESGYPIFATI